MTKILSAAQTRQLDQYTIEREPITSLQLMERASRAFVDWFRRQYPKDDRVVCLFCGPGNNGGDGFAIARLLHEAAYEVRVYACRISDQPSPDNATNEERLAAKRVVPIADLRDGQSWPKLPAEVVIVDALFGSGLNRPVAGYWAELLEWLSERPAERVSVDVPSGLFADQHTDGPVFKAHRTVSFQLPKPAFMMAENSRWVGEWTTVDIGLHAEGLAAIDTDYHQIDRKDVRALYRPRHRFDHKGAFGHALIIAGSHGKIGAAILSARAALRAGCGLVTTHLPCCGYAIMQVAFPEAMVRVDAHEHIWTSTGDLHSYRAIGVGPGIGTNVLTQRALLDLLQRAEQPLVLDADALNILGKRSDWQEHLPPNSILTPHPKEFERLFGRTDNDFTRLELLRERCRKLQCYLVLKGGHTTIGTPDGRVFFNTNGNPGMGTAGAGDVLTGILTGLLAQGYPPLHACCLGVWLHGLAGDLAAEATGQESLLAEDLIQYLGPAFRELKKPL